MINESSGHRAHHLRRLKTVQDTLPRTAILKFSIAWLLLTAMIAQATDWPHYGLDYDNQRFSGLRQINRDNVAVLEVGWSIQTGRVGSFQSTPIVRDGVMYVTTPWNDVLALNAGVLRYVSLVSPRGAVYSCACIYWVSVG